MKIRNIILCVLVVAGVLAAGFGMALLEDAIDSEKVVIVQGADAGPGREYSGLDIPASENSDWLCVNAFIAATGSFPPGSRRLALDEWALPDAVVRMMDKYCY